MKKLIKVCVTGATGFIGRKLSYELAEKGWRVHALCRSRNHPLFLPHHNITIFKGDILDLESLKEVMTDCDYTFHTAAMAKMWCKNVDDFYNVNVIGTKNVMQTALECGIKRVVHTSTCGVFGPVLNHPMCETDPRITGYPIHYERTKYLAELEVNRFVKAGLGVVIVNPSRVYGLGPITESNTVGKMVKGYFNGKWKIIPGNGESIANYAYLDDVVAGHIQALEKGIVGERYILGGEDISFNEFFKTLSEISGTNRTLFKVPIKIIKLYSQLEQLKTNLIGAAPKFLPEFADRLKSNQKYTSAKAGRDLGYTITPFKEGLKKTSDYLKNS